MKRSGIVAVAAGALLVLSGCSQGGTGDGGDGSGGVVDFLGPEDPATFAPLIAAFEAEHPDITVEYAQVPFDQYTSTLQQRLAAGDSTIDLYAVDQPNLSQLAAQGFLADLSDLSDEAQAATTPGQYDINVYDGTLWALPIWNSTQMLFYNRDALDAAGIAAPTIDTEDRWTWEQVAEAGAAAQAAGIDHGLLLEQVEAYYQVQPLIESAGGGSGIVGDDQLEVDVTNDGWQQALTWYADTFESGLSPRGVGGFQTAPVFVDGDVAFFVGGPWDVGRFANEVDFAWGVAPHPYFEGGEVATPTGSWSWGINPEGEDQDAARTFLEFAALDATGSLASTEATTIIPANTEASAEYLPSLEALGGESAVGLGALITSEVEQTAVARPVSVGYVQFESVVNTALADIRNGSDVAERLDQASGEIEEAWSQLR